MNRSAAQREALPEALARCTELGADRFEWCGGRAPEEGIGRCTPAGEVGKDVVFFQGGVCGVLGAVTPEKLRAMVASAREERA